VGRARRDEHREHEHDAAHGRRSGFDGVRFGRVLVRFLTQLQAPQQR
jgi:hypothetical protein